MSETRLVVREPGRDWSGTLHASWADRAVAALSADPVTLEELERAVTRFAKPCADRGPLPNLSQGLCDEPYDAGLIIIDLAARLVVVDSTYSSPGLEGVVPYPDPRSAKDVGLRYHLADDWLILRDREAWRTIAEERRRERAAKPLRDARAVFYGRPMLEFIAREVFAAFARRDEIAAAVRAQWTERARKRLAERAELAEHITTPLTDEEIIPKTGPYGTDASPFCDTIKQIHVNWLLTPRDDLDGACPREVGLERHDHVSWDMQDRCEQWSRLHECPPGLEPSSHAFRFGGFGTHELVKYYDLVRELLWSCWDRLTELAQSQTDGPRLELLTVGDFLTVEVPRLETVREAWLDAPDRECHGRTPRSIIERERARVPETVSRHEAVVDPDCPCCQMMSDMPGPMFWFLDGSEMDDDFAFDLHRRTREEWEEEQRSWEEHTRRFNAEWAERERLGVADSAFGERKSSVWRRSFVAEGGADVPLGARVFGVGGRLAELIVGLRDGCDRESTPPETQRQIDQLNRDFGNLRALLQSDDPSLSAALMDPVLHRFAETLAAVATARADLASQCEPLATELRTLLDPESATPAGDLDEFDIPF